MTVKDNNSNIRKSVVALGQFSNVDHAREILGTLFMQAGNPVTVRTADNSIISALGNGTYTGLVSSATALSFFIRFTDPSDANYSWNRSLPDSQSDFLAGNLATYFGFASELGQLRNQNPNLNFDVAPMPQADNGKVRVEYGKMYGFSFVKNSPNVATAYSVLSSLVAPDAQAMWVKQASLPPIRRDMISSGTTDPYLAIFYDAALISNGWLDPQSQSTSVLFQRMTDSVVSGASVINDALQNTSNALDLNIKNI
jgi:ABC-type glycerol-3-phosphate transport system substrate-binding protein